MTTWSFKSITAGAVCLALAGCATVPTEEPPATDGALSSAVLARGTVALAPPEGYCIDQESLSDTFALMARCGSLGGTTQFGAPVAVITAAVASQTVAASIFGRAFATDSETILSRRQAESITLTHVKGTPPSPGMRDVYWRGISQIDGQLLGLTIYEAKGGASLGEQAPDLLRQTLRRTKEKTAARTAAN
ncbi:hypothetical protein [Tateyamaria sp.]|uniref:hypothetical protein n=1 Tax=Tateyamaria sp. TaxID=1929288 RepID=UPI00329D1230